jgi:uncharacterized membrane protein
MGLIGASSLSVLLVLGLAFPASQGNTSDTESIVMGVGGLLSLVGVTSILSALEKTAKVFADRFVVDMYIVAFALSEAVAGLALIFDLNYARTGIPILNHVIYPVLPTNALSYEILLPLLTVEGVLLALCFLRMGRQLGSNLFKIAGIVYLAGLALTTVIGPLVSDCAPLFLIGAFFVMKTEPPASSQITWDDVPKATLMDPFSYFQLWFGEEGIAKIRPVLGNITIVFLLIFFAVVLGEGFGFNAYTASSTSSLPNAWIGFGDLALLVLFVAFVVASRIRYPRLSVQDALKHKAALFQWDWIQSARLTRGGVAIVVNGREYNAGATKSRKTLEELLKTKLGERLVVMV